MKKSDSEVIVGVGVSGVFGGISRREVDFSIPGDVLSKMRDLVESLPKNHIDMYEPSMGCEGCSGGCYGCRGDS